MDILAELEEFINEFNKLRDADFSIDTIRVEFKKQHKLKELHKLGIWSKLKKNSSLLPKLKRRLDSKEITSVWRLEKENIYYYNMQDPPKYRSATLVIFGMKQYNKEPPQKELISKLLHIMKDVSNVDICLDVPYKPNLKKLSNYFTLTPYIAPNGYITDTKYINSTGVLMLEKIIFYNKAFKNNLKGTLWRIEAKIHVPNFRVLALPLYEFHQIIETTKVTR